MKTIVQKIDKESIDHNALRAAADVLKSGGLVAFPTETVYGLGGDGLREDAAKKIYAAKGRPSDNPLIIHISRIAMLEELAAGIPEKARVLAERFWPGPLTMIFHKSGKVPFGTTGGLDTVAVRMPDHPVALALIEASGLAIAAPSANASGRPSPTEASHVYEDLDGKIDMILDGGEVGFGIESTIVDLTEEVPMILRPGCITKAMLEEAIGEVQIDKAVLAKKPEQELAPKAPGMKYRHYAPKGDLVIFEGEESKVVEEINRRAREKISSGAKVGIIAAAETKEKYREGEIAVIGSRKEEEEIARRLYGILREFDQMEADFIFSESFASDHLGQAIMNRLQKTAYDQVVRLE